MSDLQYPINIRPLSEEEGHGYLVEFPDLPGCMADGETIEEALCEAEDALHAWVLTAEEFDDPIFEPNIIDLFHKQSVLPVKE
jgi:antitoxin HicB